MTNEEYLDLRKKLVDFEQSKVSEFEKILPPNRVVKLGNTLLLTGRSSFDHSKVEPYLYAEKRNKDRSVTLNGRNFQKITSLDLDKVILKDTYYIENMTEYVLDKISKVSTDLPKSEYDSKVGFWRKIMSSIQDKCPHNFDGDYCKLCSFVIDDKE